MMTTLSLTAALLTLAAGAPPAPPPPPPVMVVEGDGLDLSSPEDAEIYAERVRRAASEFCAVHRALVTPRHVAQPRVCERAMRAAALRELTAEDLRAFSRAGGVRRLHRP